MVAERTPFGLKSRLVGANFPAARWQGVRVQRVRFQAYLIAGGFAGLSGALKVLGPNGRLATDATPTIGFTATVVAIVGMSKVPGIVMAAFFFGDLPSSGLRIVEGLAAAVATARFAQLRRRKRNRADSEGSKK